MARLFKLPSYNLCAHSYIWHIYYFPQKAKGSIDDDNNEVLESPFKGVKQKVYGMALNNFKKVGFLLYPTVQC